MKAREVNRQIERLGGRMARQSGSHRRYRAGTHYTTVPQHGGRDIPVGTLHAIERDLEPEFGKGWLITR
jgi:predicted RNA binding protein YcfA (HicA-like mRNA interferase family)